MTVQTNIGQILSDSENIQRDAIHIAVLPVTSKETIYGGMWLRFAFESTTQVLQADDESPSIMGIADPFIKGPIGAGQRFYMFVLPNTITSLRHDWTHPRMAIMEAPTPSDQAIISKVTDRLLFGAEKRLLQECAFDLDISYDDLVTAAQNYVEHGDYLSDGGKFEGASLPDGFWEAFERITRTQVPMEKQGNFFSCSC